MILFARNIGTPDAGPRRGRPAAADPAPGGARRAAAGHGRPGGRPGAAPARPARRGGRRHAAARPPRAPTAAPPRALLRAAGVNVDLAPVVDVARPGAALEGERRTYGRDARTVTARGRRVRRRACAPAASSRCSSTSPASGRRRSTPTTAPPASTCRRPTLRRVDGAPYRALRPRAVMLSTAIYPRVDPRPGGASAAAGCAGELRGRLGFGGVAITDDLEAPAVAAFGTPAQLAFFTLRAGVDLPLFAQNYATAARAADGPGARGALRRAAARAARGAACGASWPGAPGSSRAQRSPRPGPAGSRMRPWWTGSGSPKPSPTSGSVASPHGSSTRSAAAQCSAAAMPSGPSSVEAR